MAEHTEDAVERVALKPCPFCGGDDLENDGYHVSCSNCGGLGPEAMRSMNPAAQWNTRAIDALSGEPTEDAEWLRSHAKYVASLRGKNVSLFFDSDLERLERIAALLDTKPD